MGNKEARNTKFIGNVTVGPEVLQRIERVHKLLDRTAPGGDFECLSMSLKHGRIIPRTAVLRLLIIKGLTVVEKEMGLA